MTKINDPDVFVGSGDYFAMQLLYNQKLHDSINCLPRYNGNISFIRWQSKKPDWSSDNELAGEKGYAFNYDNLNRLSGNTYFEYISGKLVKSNAYQEVINDYDKNGNIKGLKRKAKSFGSPITVDNLTYTYNGNQLTGVDDAIAKSYDYDFFDNGHYYYITRTPEYLYDANGKLTQDLNKEIVNITYNELNLPKIIDFKNNSRIEYQYDALGVKKRQLVTEGGKLVKTTDFIGNFVYENNYPVYNSFDEGRIIYRVNGTYFAETYIKDHLGNIRVAYGNEVAGDPQQYGIRQVNAYYPFGMNINSLTANKISNCKRNEFLYNGKMFQDELGLDWYEYGARIYDPVICRFPSLDPKAESFSHVSPYNYAENDPVSCIDLWGLQKYRVTGSFSMTSGKIGISTNILGFGIGGTYTNGGSIQTISVSLDFDQQSKTFDCGIKFTQTEVLKESSLTYGPFNGGDITKRETTLSLSTEKGATITEEKKFSKEESGGVGVVNTTEKDGSSKTNMKTELKVNALFVGVEASQSIEYIEKQESTKKPVELPKYKVEEKDVKNHY